LPDTCEIFTDPTAADVRVVDFFDLCGWRTWRYTLRVWAPAQSDYEGHEACLAQPRLGYDIAARDLMNPAAVFLCDLEAVCRRGWKLQTEAGREHFDRIAIVSAAVTGKSGLDELVANCGGKMTGTKFREWCAKMGVPVREEQAIVGKDIVKLVADKKKARKAK
jgi:hypothetical protein